jgi:hypothetical protein
LDQDDLVSDKDLSAEDIHNVKELVSVLNNDEDDSDDFESSKSKDPVFLQMLEQYKPKTVLEKHRHSMLSVTEEYRLEDCTDLDELESSISHHFSDYFACVGWQDKTIVIFSTNDHCQHKEIIDWLSKEYKLHPSSFKVMNIQSFPLTSNGKIDYSILTRAYDN